MTIDKLNRRLNAARQATLPKIPKNWKTVEQWSSEWDLSGPRTRSLLIAAIEHKIARRKKFKVTTAAGIRSVDHYFLDEKSA